MREIKFRAWDGYKMYSPAIVDGKDWHLLEDREIKGYPLMQYTGLKDSTGNEVYEGDLVQSANGKMWEVIFADYSWKISNVRILGNGRNKFGGTEAYTFQEYIQICKKAKVTLFAIIGNIHKDPHLITVPATGNG